MKEKNYQINLDIIRIVAFSLVCTVHFFLNSNFYSTPIQGIRMYIFVFIRTFSMACVPLFLLLTGYLMSSKDISLSSRGLVAHVKKLGSILYMYLISGITIVLFKIFILHDGTTLWTGIFNITGFGQYAWYVNMYIGLYLMIPFLNLIWRNCESKEQHRNVVIVFFVLSTLPSILNIFDFTNLGSFLAPWNIKNLSVLVPNHWVTIFPFTYYFIGAYLREHVDFDPQKRFKTSLYLLFAVVFFGLMNIFRSYRLPFVWNAFNDWGSLQSMSISVLLFLTIKMIRFNSASNKTIIIKRLSKLTFMGYLLSWIPDQFVYPTLNRYVVDIHHQIFFLPITVFVVILTSLFLVLNAS